MRLKCLLGKHEPAGGNILPYKSCMYNWLRKCKYCDKYIAQNKSGRSILTDAQAAAIVKGMRKVHTAVKMLAKLIKETADEDEQE